MGKRLFISKSLVLSLVGNICLLCIIMYLSFIKTDISKKVLAKIGIVDYNPAIYRHQLEYRCLEGWANSLSKLQIKADIVFYGNSITYESNFQNYFPQLRVCNLGCNRDDLEDLIHRSFLIHKVCPSKIFVLGGINNLMEISIEDFKEKYNTLVDTIIAQNPNAKLYLQSLLPVNINMELGSRYTGNLDKIKKANQIIKDISKAKRCFFVEQ